MRDFFVSCGNFNSTTKQKTPSDDDVFCGEG